MCVCCGDVVMWGAVQPVSVGPAEESSHLKYNGRKPLGVPGLLHIPFCRYTSCVETGHTVMENDQ